jgi:hypothetical protein
MIMNYLVRATMQICNANRLHVLPLTITVSARGTRSIHFTCLLLSLPGWELLRTCANRVPPCQRPLLVPFCLAWSWRRQPAARPGWTTGGSRQTEVSRVEQNYRSGRSTACAARGSQRTADRWALQPTIVGPNCVMVVVGRGVR